MKKILCFIAGCLVALSINAQTCGNIKVIEVVDGDTLRAEMIGVPSPLNRVLIRISGIDTPEIKGECNSEKENAQAAKSFLNKKLSSTYAVTFGAIDRKSVV
jgi:endonuclease YncB( thermonuclease family)